MKSKPINFPSPAPLDSFSGDDAAEGFLCLMTYTDKLKSPKWQRKRLETLQSADFKCQLCDHQEKPLHVHHPIYITGLDPWDYPTETLMVLCDECHTERQGIERQFFYKVSLAIRYKSNLELKQMPVWWMFESRSLEGGVGV